MNITLLASRSCPVLGSIARLTVGAGCRSALLRCLPVARGCGPVRLLLGTWQAHGALLANIGYGRTEVWAKVCQRFAIISLAVKLSPCLRGSPYADC